MTGTPIGDDIVAGLEASPKWLPSKYFYDGRGSALFERITRLPEYYLTRAETAILESNAESVVARCRPEELVELGSGSSRKTRLLLEAMHRSGAGSRYVALDVSDDALRAAEEALLADYAWLEFAGVVGDFHTDLAAIPRRGPRLVAFLGSTIGNLDPAERATFFPQVRDALQRGDAFLLGLDLVKDVGVLEEAYDDAAGITAEFNRNILAVLNRELDADFPIDAFDHVAVFDKVSSWIEMRLRATRDMVVTLPPLDLRVTLLAGEEIRTEISCKFTREQIEAELVSAGLGVEGWMTDGEQRFAIALAMPVGP
jgi:L-histidine N-alpha-methyltransferase